MVASLRSRYSTPRSRKKTWGSTLVVLVQPFGAGIGSRVSSRLQPATTSNATTRKRTAERYSARAMRRRPRCAPGLGQYVREREGRRAAAILQASFQNEV